MRRAHVHGEAQRQRETEEDEQIAALHGRCEGPEGEYINDHADDERC